MMKRWKSTDDLTLHEIAEVLARGGIVVLPTDTVYGLHASANNQRAVNRVAEMKGRSADKPFIVIAASIDDVEALFGRSHTRADRSDGFMWYYALPIYNPFEEQGGRR